MKDEDYIRYDGTETHLHASLEEISKFRHKGLESSLRTFLSEGVVDCFNPNETPEFVKMLAGQLLLTTFYDGKKISVFLRNHPNWSKMETMLNDFIQLDNDDIDLHSIEMLQKEMTSLYESMMDELLVDIEMQGAIDVMARDATTVVKGIGDLTKNQDKTYGAIKSFANSDLLNSQEAADLNKADLLVIHLTAEACGGILNTGISAFEFDPNNKYAFQETKDKLDQIQEKVNSLFLEQGIDTGQLDLLKYSEETFKSAGTENSPFFKEVFGKVMQVEKLVAEIERMK